MKLRITGNSLRLRLDAGEIAALADAGKLEEAVEFRDGGRLSYSLELSAGLVRPNATFDGSRIRLFLPAEQGRSWITSDLVGIEETIATGDGNELKVLVEKDLSCLHEKTGTKGSRAL
jgi:hypothetical protein